MTATQPAGALHHVDLTVADFRRSKEFYGKILPLMGFERLPKEFGAVAGILRQRSAELLETLKRQGWEFTGIRVRVQVSFDPAPMPKPVANPLDRAALRPLSELARTLPKGALKAAVERLLRRVG